MLNLALGDGVLILLALLIPPSVMLLIWRPRPQTVAEVLHDASSAARRNPR